LESVLTIREPAPNTASGAPAFRTFRMALRAPGRNRTKGVHSAADLERGLPVRLRARAASSASPHRSGAISRLVRGALIDVLAAFETALWAAQGHAGLLPFPQVTASPYLTYPPKEGGGVPAFSSKQHSA